MPTRRKNVDFSRLRRSCKKNKVCELFSSYAQYILIILIWGVLLLVNQSTDMRFEYFWPVWLSVCSMHDVVKLQGLQCTIVLIIIVLTVDLVCFFIVPMSWVYTFGSVYVWVYLLWNTDQGLCFFTLSLCFVFIYFEFSFYSKKTESVQSFYLFRPFAAHSIGYSVVCVGFSVKRYLDFRYESFKRTDVRRQNFLHFRILYESLPPSAIESAYVQHSLDCFQKDPLRLHGIKISDGFPSDFSSRSMFLLFRFGHSYLSRLSRCVFRYLGIVDKHCSDFDGRTGSTNHASPTVINGIISNASTIDSGQRRAVQCLESNPSSSQTSRRYITDNSMNTYSYSKLSVNCGVPKQSTNGKPARERNAKEDPVTRLESNVRRLRSELQSMRALETQLRNQLSSLQHDDRLNKLSLSSQRQENEGISSRIAKLTNKCRTERGNLNAAEQNLSDEIRLRQLVESQLTEMCVIPACSVLGSSETNNVPSDSTGRCVATSIPRIQISANNDTSMNANVIILHAKESENLMNNCCCKLRQLLESKLYALKLTVKHHENLTVSKMSHGDHLIPKYLTNTNLQEVDTSDYNKNVHQYNQQPISLRLKSEHFLTKDVYCCILNSNVEDLHITTNNSHDTSTNKHRHAFLENCFNLANEKRERLANKLRTENWQKQELLTLYHTSVREITELNKTLKQRDLQILELTMKIEQLECLPKSTIGYDYVSYAGYITTSTTLSANDFTKTTGDKQFIHNKQQHMPSLLSNNTDGLFNNASTNTFDNMFIHTTPNKYYSGVDNNTLLQTSRNCTSSATSLMDFKNYNYPEICLQTTHHYKNKQDSLFTNSVIANFHTNLSSSCLLPPPIHSSPLSSPNMSCVPHTDVQVLINYKE
ncbi:Transmembrane protein 57 [Schistosoma japonicum]|nr:Transmembrane protein 57 [Schistosoma japonicum]KAH8865569.1 Transmembrane protein 57 [Schistosoma japonicum]